MLKKFCEFKNIASVQSAFRAEYKTKIASKRKVIINIVSVFEKPIQSLIWLQKEKNQVKNKKTPKISLKPW